MSPPAPPILPLNRGFAHGDTASRAHGRGGAFCVHPRAEPFIGISTPGWIMATVALFLAALLGGCTVQNKISVLGGFPEPLRETVVEPGGPGKVALIPIEGLITDMGGATPLFGPARGTVDRVTLRLARAEADPAVKAIVLRLNTPGGGVTASDLLHRELSRFKARSRKPIVAMMMDVCASGGVYVAMAADYIFAAPTTITGSVGVVFVNLNVTGLLDKIGVADTTVASGPHKTMGSPLRPPNAADQALIQTLVDELHNRFKSIIAAGRPGLSPERINAFADGRLLSASQALEHGLVDGLGDLRDAIAEAARRAGIVGRPTVVAWRETEQYDETPYGVDAAATGTPWRTTMFSGVTPGMDSRSGLPHSGMGAAATAGVAEPLLWFLVARGWGAPSPGFHYLWLGGSAP